MRVSSLLDLFLFDIGVSNGRRSDRIEKALVAIDLMLHCRIKSVDCYSTITLYGDPSATRAVRGAPMHSRRRPRQKTRAHTPSKAAHAPKFTHSTHDRAQLPFFLSALFSRAIRLDVSQRLPPIFCTSE